MRTLMITLLVLLFYWVSAMAEQPAGDPVAGEKKAQACMDCHHSPISLSGRGVEEIASQIKAIRAGDKGHPPGITALSDQDILDIATFLNKG